MTYFKSLGFQKQVSVLHLPWSAMESRNSRLNNMVHKSVQMISMEVSKSYISDITVLGL